MTGFSGAWYLESGTARQWANIIWPRLVAGREPFPIGFGPASMRTSDGQQMVVASNADRLDFFDENGMYDRAKDALYAARKRGGWDVAVISLAGVMSRTGMCGEGTEFTAQVLQAAAQNKGVGAVVLHTNSPGGTADSTRMLADVVRDFPKPILIQTPGAYSAAYFVASQGREVWLDPQAVAGVGSIGTVYVHVDDSAQKEKQGIVEEPIVSAGSEDKLIYGGYNGLTPEYRAFIQETLASASREFKGYVRRGRAGKLSSEEVLTGKIYRGKQAVDLGMVDGIASLDEAIKRARRMA